MNPSSLMLRFSVLFLLLASFGISWSQPPNVVLIFADDLGYGDLSCYGQTAYQTPRIDELAKEGVRATEFYVPVPYCAPSRGALLTGRVPLRNGLYRNPHPDLEEVHDRVGLNPEEITLAEVYQENGYATAAFGKWHLGHRPQFYPTRHGFDHYYGILYSNDMLPVQIMENETVAVASVDQRTLTRDYTIKSVEFIRKNRDRPFFLYLPHPMPHKPLAASNAFYTPETPDDLYADVIRELDWSVGEIVDTLESEGLLESTIIVFTSDNGPFYGGSTGGLRGMKGTSWDGGLKVPFVIRYPKALPEGTTVSTPLWSLDIFPTLLALCGLNPPEGRHLDGMDITNVLDGAAVDDRPVFSFHDQRFTSIRYGDWKLYLDAPRALSARDLNPNWVDPRGPDGVSIIAQMEQPNNDQYPGLKPPVERPTNRPLFNVVQDPGEAVDLANQKPEVVAKLTAAYEAFEASLSE